MANFLIFYVTVMVRDLSCQLPSIVYESFLVFESLNLHLGIFDVNKKVYLIAERIYVVICVSKYPSSWKVTVHCHRHELKALIST